MTLRDAGIAGRGHASGASPQRAEDSLRKRYGYKLLANVLGVGISAVTQAIIPRGLGPRAYGDFAFLTNFFSQVVSFLEMGTGTAFYTKLSQRPTESSLVTFYLHGSAVIALATFGAVLLPAATGTEEMLWPGQTMASVALAALFSLLTWMTTMVSSMADAYGVTVHAELSRMLQKIVGLLLIVVMLYLNVLDLTTFFYYHYVLLLLLGTLLICAVRGHLSPWRWRLPRTEVRSYAREFYLYSHPLFTYSLVGLCSTLFDRWMLQTFHGSEEQGYYGLSFQIGALCFLFTGAMTPLFMRELSIAFGSRDTKRMADLFHRYIPLLYAIAAYFSCFIVIQAETVTHLFGGEKFSAAVPAVAVMAAYPLHQTYGQLSGSVFLATGQTTLYRNIGITMMLIGLPVTYFIIAPPAQGGLGMGAYGLAVKMVVVNIVWVNLQLYYNARYLAFSFRDYLRHQVLSVGYLVTLSLVSTVIVAQLLGPGKRVAAFVLTGALYTASAAVSTYYFPGLFGLKKDDLASLVRLLRERLR